MLSHPFIGVSTYRDLNQKTYDILTQSGATSKSGPTMQKDTNILPRSKYLYDNVQIIFFYNFDMEGEHALSIMAPCDSQ
jgi:hypothetical protein